MVLDVRVSGAESSVELTTSTQFHQFSSHSWMV